MDVVRRWLFAIGYFVGTWGLLATLAASAQPMAGVLVAIAGIASTVPLVLYIRWRRWPFYPTAAFRLFVIRPVLYANLMLPLVSAAALLGLIGGALVGDPLGVGRIVASAVAAVIGTVLLAGYIGSKRLVVRHVDIDVPGLDPAFDNLRIVQLSDLHVGPHTSRRFLERVVASTKSLAPDLVAVTGDLIDDRAEDVAVYAKVLGAIDAPLGVFMIPGNHDVYAGWDDVERRLRAAKLGTVLVNDAHVIHRGRATIALIGTGDPAGGRRGASRAAPDIERALARVPARATVVAFAHNPALWPALASRGVALTLSGHTHWGQLALPRLGWSMASPFLQYAMGAHLERDSMLYISPGTGYWGIPFRIGASHEVTLVTLRRAKSAAARVHPPRAA